MPVLAQANELALPVREGDITVLEHLATLCEFQVAGEVDSVFKTNVLLQCHFSRRALPIDLDLDLKTLLKKSLKLVHAMVDVVSNSGSLNSTMSCMEISQMLVQAVWPNKSPLMQLPGFDEQLIGSLKNENVHDIGDFMNMEDE